MQPGGHPRASVTRAGRQFPGSSCHAHRSFPTRKRLSAQDSQARLAGRTVPTPLLASVTSDTLSVCGQHDRAARPPVCHLWFGSGACHTLHMTSTYRAARRALTLGHVVSLFRKQGQAPLPRRVPRLRLCPLPSEICAGEGKAHKPCPQPSSRRGRRGARGPPGLRPVGLQKAWRRPSLTPRGLWSP